MTDIPEYTPVPEYRNPFYKPAEPVVEEVSINPQDYPTPHEFMWVMRGVPMGTFQGTEIPPINIPPECQQAFAVHLKLCGFEHNPDKQVIVHMKPVAGDDTPMNPGTWVRKSDIPAEELDQISPMSTSNTVEPDLSMLDYEHLATLEAAIKKAKIVKDMAAQADPDARKAAEDTLAPESPPAMPSEAELKASMDPSWGTERTEPETSESEGDSLS